MNLYQINNKILSLLTTVDEETGELTDEVFDRLAELSVEFETKTENIALYVKDLLGDAEKIKAEEQTLYKRRRALENNAERLKKYLASGMLQAGKKKIETSRAKITTRDNSAVEILDMDALPADYVKTKIELSADKRAIADAIKKGESVSGAELVTRTSVIIK